MFWGINNGTITFLWFLLIFQGYFGVLMHCHLTFQSYLYALLEGFLPVCRCDCATADRGVKIRLSSKFFNIIGAKIG